MNSIIKGEGQLEDIFEDHHIMYSCSFQYKNTLSIQGNKNSKNVSSIQSTEMVI